MGKTIELSRVRQGEHFTLDGVEWVKLDETHMGAFVVAVDALPDNCPFESDDDREDANNFCGSHIAKEMERWLRDQHKPIFDATLERPIDLTTMDGMTDYDRYIHVWNRRERTWRKVNTRPMCCPIALYATVRLGQVFPVVDLSKQAIETILGVNVLKVVENIFEHNDGPVFGTTNEAAKEIKRDF